MKQKLHTILVPVYNSMETINILVDRVSRVMNDGQIRFELVLVDDGSSDGSFDEIRRLSKIHACIRGFRLSRNFGHQADFVDRFEKMSWRVYRGIDNDLQDPPEILPEFFRQLYTEVDVIYGIRGQRKENFIIKFLYTAFYRILRLLSKVEIPLDAGDFCVMKRCVVDSMLQFREANPFLRGIRSWVGFKQIGVEYHRNARLQGEAGYTLKKYFALAFISGDFYNREDLSSALQGQDIVYHFISVCTPIESWNDPFIEIDINLRPSIQFFELAIRKGVRKIVFPSLGGTVYGPQKELVNEGSVLSPISPHGITKLTTEHFLQYFRKHAGIQADIYRIGNPYGPR
jgi:dolichol-phosphate mannosyltransferase